MIFKKTLVGLIKLYPRLHLFKFIFSLWFKVESWSKFLFEYVYKSNVLYRVLQTTKTTANHQQCNQEMLSSSITSMRFYFIFPYVPPKKNIYAPSNQTHRTAIHMSNFKEYLLWCVPKWTVKTCCILFFEPLVHIYAIETKQISVLQFFYFCAYYLRPSGDNHLTQCLLNIKHKRVNKMLN